MIERAKRLVRLTLKEAILALFANTNYEAPILH
jgi:hypothetical protein